MAASSGDDSLAESTASKRLHDLLRGARKACTQLAILLVGPSGTGKSALARSSLHSTGFHIRSLDFRQLCHDDSITSIAAIVAAFQPTQGGEATAVLLDDLDFWAPAPDLSNAVSAMDIRIIAALSDALESTSEFSQPFAFIATACDEGAVHSSLRYPGRLKHVLRLCPLSVEERISLAKVWLRRASKTSVLGEDDDLGGTADHIAAVTPGFVHADFCQLFSAVELQLKIPRGANGGEIQTRLVGFLSGPQFCETVKSVTPSLLTTSVGSSAFAPDGTSSVTTDTLYGLDSAIERFRECITAVFVSSTHNSSMKDPQLTTSIRILQALGTFRGLILHGPTGCGKTAMTRLASSLLAKNTVNFLHVDSTSIVSSVIGEAERKLTKLFAVARAIAPSLLVLENIDVLAPSRDLVEGDGGSASEAFNRLLSTFLTQIDGVHWRNEEAPVFIIATTRSLKLTDSALLRPGRFEIHIGVHPPDALSRVRILKAFLESKNVQLREGLGKKIQFNFDNFKADSHGWTAPDVFAFGRELLMDEKRADTLSWTSS